MHNALILKIKIWIIAAVKFYPNSNSLSIKNIPHRVLAVVSEVWYQGNTAKYSFSSSQFY